MPEFELVVASVVVAVVAVDVVAVAVPFSSNFAAAVVEAVAELRLY